MRLLSSAEEEDGGFCVLHPGQARGQPAPAPAIMSATANPAFVPAQASASGSAAFEARIELLIAEKKRKQKMVAALTRLRKLDADTIAELTQQQQRDMAVISRLEARPGSKPGTAADGHTHNPRPPSTMSAAKPEEYEEHIG